MEDYSAAFLRCVLDVETLHNSRRHVAAMHFGGVAIECLLKDMILTTLPQGAKREWKTDTNNPGHTFYNPGHSFEAALRCHNKLRNRVQTSNQVLAWFNLVENPKVHFIDMRYQSLEPDEEIYRKWYKSYTSLLNWLQVQGSKI